MRGEFRVNKVLGNFIVPALATDVAIDNLPSANGKFKTRCQNFYETGHKRIVVLR
jgi:hypothetical protein